MFEHVGDLGSHLNGVAIELDAHGEMPFVRLEDDLVEVAVSDDHVSQPAAIEIAALSGNHEQRRVNEQFFEEVRRRTRSVQHALTLRELDALATAVRDIANVRTESEDRVAEIVHDKRLLRDRMRPRGVHVHTSPHRLR
jgi:hypothetical protein